MVVGTNAKSSHTNLDNPFGWIDFAFVPETNTVYAAPFAASTVLAAFFRIDAPALLPVQLVNELRLALSAVQELNSL